MLQRIVSLFFIIFAVNLYASRLEITPLTLNLTPSDNVKLINIYNLENKKTAWQLHLMRWDQSHMQNTYSPAPELLATPMIFSLLPKKYQLLRVTNTSLHQFPNREVAYRLFIKEIPLPQIPKKNSLKPQLQLLLYVSMPIFIEPALIHKKYQYTFTEHQLQIHNSGNIHLLLLGYQLKSKIKECNKKEKIFAYILPGKTWEKKIQPKNCQEKNTSFFPVFDK